MKQEASSVSGNLEENYILFISQAFDMGCVWGLQNEEGWAVCPSVDNDELDVMPMWSQPEFAKALCSGDWQQYEVVPISLEELLDDWLPGLHQDLILVGPNWNEALEGEEVEPLDLLEDFDKAVSEEN